MFGEATEPLGVGGALSRPVRPDPEGSGTPKSVGTSHPTRNGSCLGWMQWFQSVGQANVTGEAKKCLPA
jgi:hypothetical protein